MYTVFMSTSASLRVSFPPEVFGVTKDYTGGDIHWPSVKFDDGTKKLNDEDSEECKVIGMLRIHSGNECNGGDSFWEQPEADTEAILGFQQFASGKPVSQASDKELIDKDVARLKELEKWVTKPFAPPQRVKVCDTLDYLISRFDVVGMETPNPDSKTRTLKAACVRLLDYFEEEEIWKENKVENEGTQDTGGS